MNKQKTLMFATMVMAILVLPALADIPTPSGTNPATGQAWAMGDPYRLAFITSTNGTGPEGTGPGSPEGWIIDDFNAHVQGLADAAGMGGIAWYVIGSTVDVTARDNTSTNPTVDGEGCPILLVDGTTIVAENNADLWDGEVQNTISMDENGVAKDHWPFTGTGPDGTRTGANFGPLGQVGGSVNQGQSAVATNWIHREWTGDPPATALPLYAMSEPLFFGIPTIPYVTGQPQATAVSNIEAAGFTVGAVTTGYSDTLASGLVISQSAVGPAQASTVVDLVVSLGLPIIPDVTGQLQATAVSNIIAAGFTVGEVTTANSDIVAAGDVISQDAIGPAPSGTVVDLLVSLGEEDGPCIPGDIDGNCIVNILDLALLAGQWLEDRDPFIESDGLVVIEAEHYMANYPAGGQMWVAKDVAGSIADGCVQALPDLSVTLDSNIETTSPHLIYEINFTTTGTYYVWARGMADNASDDSVHYGLDGVAVSTGDADSIEVNTASFAWSNGNSPSIASINITSAGPHTLDIWMREDGIFLDRLLLTTNSGYTPVQPDESDSAIELIANIDGIGGVNMSDYSIISENWQDSFTPVIINEFMASNATTLDDEDDASSDWIEIYNRSAVTVDMTGWYLTDEADVPNMWQFTAGPVLASGEYAVIFASEKSGPSYPMHTNFSLNVDGEYLGLCFPDQSVADEFSLEYPAQATDISYGWFDGQLRYFANPTPGWPNESGYLGLMPDTKFSIDRGFYNTAFDVAITCDDPSAIIRYTTNSENPSATVGLDYTGPVSISETTVLKARAIRPGWVSSNVDTQTYIFVSDVKAQSDTTAPGAGWPDPGDASGVLCSDGTECGTLDYYGILQYMDYGMDPEIVGTGAPYETQIEDSLLSIPSMSISTNIDNLFDENTGIFLNAYGDTIEWERPASMELIYPNGTKGFQIDMGLRIRGGWSRQGGNPKHAFRCFFRSEYGDSKLKYPLFDEEGVDEFDKIDLRAAQNYSWSFCGDWRSTFCHEVFTRDTQAEMGEPYTRSRYYHLYLNGHYWGLFR